tara:strand:- start:260 stop:544 length:285 start_codon:yes stop_codon:yes gene_type:complete
MDTETKLMNVLIDSFKLKPRNPWDYFDPNDEKACLALEHKLRKHVSANDGRKCLGYVDLVFKHWDAEHKYPGNGDLVRKAYALAKQYVEGRKNN